jgi:putative transposase
MSFRDVEDLLAERGITVSYEAVRRWCQKFAADYARRLRKRQGRLGDSWHVDELFVRINGQQQYLWRAVDQDGDVIDILLQPHRDRRAAERFFQRLFRREGKEPLRIITDRLKSYGAALRTMCRTLLTTRAVTLTIARKSLISTPDKENSRCAGSNLDNRRSDF